MSLRTQLQSVAKEEGESSDADAKRVVKKFGGDEDYTTMQSEMSSGLQTFAGAKKMEMRQLKDSANITPARRHEEAGKRPTYEYTGRTQAPRNNQAYQLTPK